MSEEHSDQVQPAFAMLANYMKDLSFENPNALKTIGGNQGQPTFNLNVAINRNPAGQPDTHEVELKVTVTAQGKDVTIFVVEATFAGLFLIRGVTQEQFERVVLVDCPTMLFPFARRIIGNATADGGYPPLTIDALDFVKLYNDRKEQGLGADQPSVESDTAGNA